MRLKKVDSFNKASVILVLSIILGTVTYAWTGPTDTAPNGNVPAPINVGSSLQEKLGSLKIRGAFTITGGNKGYSELTQDADDESTLVTKSYVDAKIPKNCQTSLTTDVNGNFVCTRIPQKTTYAYPGTYSYIVPDGVTTVTVTGTAGGGSGFSMGPNPGGSWFYSGSGGGGVIEQAVSVTPGETLTVIVGGTEANTYLRRGGVDLVSLGAGSRGASSPPAGGSGPLPGSSGSYQACMMTSTKGLSGASSYPAIGSSYGYGGYSECDYAAGSGGTGYFEISG